MLGNQTAHDLSNITFDHDQRSPRVIDFLAYQQAALAQKTIGTQLSRNNYDTSSRKECEKDSDGEPVYDEVDDDIASYQKSMFLFQSRLGQEQCRKIMVDG